MLVGRNVQELDKPPHQEQQAGPGYMTLGDVMPLRMPLAAGKR